ncbi:MAG: drug/metabolite exporter YedA [Anaerolineae bacterium]|nr:drug/metabolite exporter YedA [Anaerolineae bacterium]
MRSEQSQLTDGTSHGSPSPFAVWTAMFAVYIVWGSTYLAIRFAVETIPPFLMASARFLVAGIVLYTWRRAQGDPTPSKSEWRSAAIVGLCLLLGGNGGVVWAEQHVASSVAALLVASTPLWMALIDALRPGGQKPSIQTILGIVIGFCGIALLIGPSQLLGGTGSVDSVGALVVLGAAFSWSVGSLYSRKAQLPASPLLGTGMEMLAGGTALLLLGIFTGELGRLRLATITPASWLGLGYLIIFGSWVGFSAYTWLLRVAPTPLVSTYAYVNPVVAVVLGCLFAGEPLTARSFLATAIIVSAVVLTTRRPSSKSSSAVYVPPTSKLVDVSVTEE